jgi:predicted dehydrogenase
MKIGIVGAAGRGKNFKAACEACDDVKIHAVCDINEKKIAEAKKNLGASEQYTDYYEMLEKSDIQAVVIGTPMHFHAEQSIAALEKDIHVLCEVTAGTSVEECKAIVSAAKASKAIYMMAENYCYMKNTATLKNLAAKGFLGEIFYAEGEYIHDCTSLADNETPWRRHWQMGIDGITYCTHSLGPILQCMKDDRVERVCCEAAGKHRKDKNGKYFHRHCPTMLCKTEKGALIKIRVDITSRVPHNMTYYRLQGTEGAFDDGKIWFRDLSEKVQWHDFEKITKIDAAAAKYVPAEWKNPPEKAREAGHGGGDYFEILDFINAVKGEIPCPIGVHEAMDMTLPGLISQQSIKEDGRWIEVPDSRDW